MLQSHEGLVSELLVADGSSGQGMLHAQLRLICSEEQGVDSENPEDEHPDPLLTETFSD